MPYAKRRLSVRRSVRTRLVPATPVGAAALLHLGLVDVAAAAPQGVADRLLVRAEHLPVGVVELLDDLERPAPRDDVAAEQLLLQALRDVVLAALAQAVQDLVERQVGLADQLVEAVEVPAGALELL